MKQLHGLNFLKEQKENKVNLGKKAQRRDYSKVSGTLPLPNLVEIQTDSYEWFKKEGVREVFNEIYPITNYAGNISLKFVDYEFGTPKYDIDECKVPYEQREEIAVNSVKTSMITVTSILLTGLVGTIVICLVSPLTYGVASTYVAMAISIIVGGLATLFLLIPVYLYLEKNLRLDK